MCIADLLVNVANKLSSKLKAINASLANKGQAEAESFDDVPAKIDAINGGVANPILQAKTITPSKSQQSVIPDSGYDGLNEVTVKAIPAQYIIPSGTVSLSYDGTYDVSKYNYATVSVENSNDLQSVVFQGSKTTMVEDDDSYVRFGLYISDNSLYEKEPTDILIMYAEYSLPEEGVLTYSTYQNFGYYYGSEGLELYPLGVHYRIDGNKLSIWSDSYTGFPHDKNYDVVIVY